MILTFIFDFFITIFNGLVSLLPTATLPTAVASGFASVIGYMYLFNNFFPVDTFLYLAGLGIILELALMGWNIGLTILNYIRGD